MNLSTDVHSEEKSLLKKCALGDKLSFEIVFEKYRHKLFVNALKFTRSVPLAEDFVQETFIQIWIHRTVLENVKKLDCFLFTVSRNLMISKLKKPRGPHCQYELYSDCLDSSLPNGQEHAEAKDIEKKIREAIERLPAQQQMAFRLSRFHGLTHEEIAHTMNISKTTSQNYIARAIVSIKKQLRIF